MHAALDKHEHHVTTVVITSWCSDAGDICSVSHFVEKRARCNPALLSLGLESVVCQCKRGRVVCGVRRVRIVWLRETWLITGLEMEGGCSFYLRWVVLGFRAN